MSYDLMVFRNDSAPRKTNEFMDWYLEQTEWAEEHSYDDPANTSDELRNWFMEIIITFPAMNGPFASEDYENPNLSDYCIGKDVIYVGFAWPVAVKAYRTMIKLAAKHNVGFFNVSSENGEILFSENGNWVKINDTKRWWEFWKK
jgi:hypothetical protein